MLKCVELVKFCSLRSKKKWPEFGSGSMQMIFADQFLQLCVITKKWPQRENRQFDIEKFTHLLVIVYYGADERNAGDRGFKNLVNEGHVVTVELSAHFAKIA